MVLLLLGHDQQQGTSVSQPEPLPRHIDVALRNVTFSETRDGVAIWELVADRAVHDKGGDVVLLENIRMVFSKTGTAGKLTMTAQQGEYANTTQDVSLSGSVHVITESGIDFTTDSVGYSSSRRQIHTNDPVTFRQQRLQLTAKGMTLDIPRQKVHFAQQIQASVSGLPKQTSP